MWLNPVLAIHGYLSPSFAKVGFNVARNISGSPNPWVTCSRIAKHREMLFAPSLGAEQSQAGRWGERGI